MRTPNRIALGLAMMAVAPLAKAQAPDKSEEMWQMFYAKLGSMVHTIDAKSKKPANNTRFLMCFPGRFIRKLDSKIIADRAEVAQMLDEVPQFGVTYTPIMGTRFSTIYKEILDYKNADPDALNSEEQQRLAEALEATKPDSKLMEKYYEHEDHFLQAAQKCEIEYFKILSEGGYADRSRLSAGMIRADQQWIIRGNKNLVKGYLETIMSLSMRGTQVWWSDRLENFQSAKIGGFMEVDTFPTMDSWNSDEGWTKFEFRKKDVFKKERLNESDFEASASLKILPWGGSASGKSNTKAIDSLNTDNSLSISMEFKKVFISRPWMDWGVFTSDRWNWNGRKAVSDGKGGGRMPLYANAFILVRKVKFTAESIREHHTELMKEIRGRGRAGWGPFSTSTSFGGKTEEKVTDNKQDEGSIEINDPQIIGYTCTQVPPCPAKQFQRK
ncbi:MAG: hypothetical protein HGA66_05125 [Holophaga sp.]|nr:hypothetical protein [Holophaga sp.]